MKHFLCITLAVLLMAAPIRAQDDCNLDISTVQLLLSEAAVADDAAALGLISEARAALEQIEGRCRNYAPDSAGDSRLNPVPFGQRQHAVIPRDFIGSIELLEFLPDGEAFVLAANRRNVPAPDGTRYIVFRLNYVCEVSPAESCNFSPTDFSVVGRKGVSYRYNSGSAYDISLRGVTDMQEVFGGGEIEVTLMFLVKADDGDFVLFTEYGSPRVFFASE